MALSLFNIYKTLKLLNRVKLPQKSSQIRYQRTSRNEKDENLLKKKIKIDEKKIKKLERLALVDFGNESGIRRLEAAIDFADKLKKFPVDDKVEPLYCVLEQEALRLREDRVTEGNCREEILKNAVVTEDEYFVAPRGNVPLKGRVTAAEEDN